MPITHSSIISLLEYVKIDTFSITCYFKCEETNKRVVSIVAFEPYEGKIEFTWQEILFHPFKSYNRYYHTPITIYGSDIHETIVLKAFKKIADKFTWNSVTQSYVYMYHQL